MSATWEIKIGVLDRAARRIRVTGTRTDVADVRCFSVDGVVDPKNLAASRAALLAALQAKYEASVDQAASDAALLTGWAANLKSAMNSWETK